MNRVSIGCIVGGRIGAEFLKALAERAIKPAFVIEADGKSQIGGGDIPFAVDLLITIGSTAFVTAEARAMAGDAIGYHPSLLPKHKGRHAVRDTIAADDVTAGGSIYRLTDGWDEGEVLAQESCSVLQDDTPGTLWRRDLMPMGVRMMVRAVVCAEKPTRGANSR